jgi:hypothetical protein
MDNKEQPEPVIKQIYLWDPISGNFYGYGPIMVGGQAEIKPISGS